MRLATMGKVCHSASINQIPDEPACIPPGEYDLRFVYHETRHMFRHSPKVILWFDVITFGPHVGVRLARYYNAERLTGKSGRNGPFKVMPRSDLMREYVMLFNEKPRRDRIPMNRYEHAIIIGRVETVTKDSNQRIVPQLLHYSVIRELVRIKQI
jgi:hypothetical protein